MLRKILIGASAIVALGVIALLSITVMGDSKLVANPFIDFSKKNPPVSENINKELSLLTKGKDISSSFSKQVLLDIAYGFGEENLGFREFTAEPPGWIIAPGAIAVGRNGDIYIADPANGEMGLVTDPSVPIAANKAIKVYSKNGKYLRKIPVDINKGQFGKEWIGDFGLDARDNLYILSPGRVYKKGPGQDSFEPIGPELNEAHRLEVAPSSSFSVLDKTLPPDDNLRVQKLDTKGKLLDDLEQHGFDHNMFDFEDEKGQRVSFSRLGGGSQGAQYIISRHAPQKEEVIYEGYLPDGYYYIDKLVIGFDAKGNMYLLRVVAPDMLIDTEEDAIERDSKTEVWVDFIDLRQGEVSSVRLEAERRLGGTFGTPHHYAVDSTGNIYQLQVDRQGVKVLKYSQK